MADPQSTEVTTSPHFDPHASTIPHLPDPSIFPLILGIGMTLLPLGVLWGVFPMMNGEDASDVFFGLVVFGLGLLVFAIGLGGWLYEDTQTHLKARHTKH